MDGADEPALYADLEDPELARPWRSAQAPGLADDLVRSRDDLESQGDRQARPTVQLWRSCLACSWLQSVKESHPGWGLLPLAARSKGPLPWAAARVRHACAAARGFERVSATGWSEPAKSVARQAQSACLIGQPINHRTKSGSSRRRDLPFRIRRETTCPCEAIIESQSGCEIGACGEDRGPSGEIAGSGRVKPCSAR